MIDVLIIEDETPAIRRLQRLVAQVADDARVVGGVDSIRAARIWLKSHPCPNLILADIQLGDGLSFEIFAGTLPSCPIVFVTAYDEYLLRAFGEYGIAYLLKPIEAKDLAGAFAKYRELGRHFAGHPAKLLASLQSEPRFPVRVVANRAGSMLPLDVNQIAFCMSQDKMTFAVTKGNERMVLNESLTDLASKLDPKLFFRVNRNFLVQAASIQSFAPIGKGRLTLRLLPAPATLVQVSQERGAAFRAWIAS